MPIHLEFSLDYLIRRCDLAGARADRRLDGFENAIALLARRWRPERPLAPARELRMARETRDSLLAWVEADTPPGDGTVARLGVYASGAVTDDAVPTGWVRLHLDAAAAAH